MAEEKEVVVVKADDTPSEAMTERFLKLSGCKASSIIGSSKSRRTYVTDNGGKYQLNSGGTKLTTLMGPDYPRAKRAAPAEDE